MGNRGKEANRNDLRWRRTERHLMEALSCQLASSTLDKVKVTEICRDAEVSKATFYLHYQDIYELADAFVDSHVGSLLDDLGDPCLPFYDIPAFVDAFVDAMRSNEHVEFMKIADENRMTPLFMNRLLHRLEERLDARVPAPEGIGHRIGLAFLISGLGGAVQSSRDIESDELKAHLTELISAALDHEAKLRERSASPNGEAASRGMQQAASRPACEHEVNPSSA